MHVVAHITRVFPSTSLAAAIVSSGLIACLNITPSNSSTSISPTFSAPVTTTCIYPPLRNQLIRLAASASILEFRVMNLAKQQNCGQTFGYATTRTPGAVPPGIVSNLHPPPGGAARTHRRRGPGGTPAQPGRTEPGHAAPLVLALRCARRGALDSTDALRAPGPTAEPRPYRVAGCRRGRRSTIPAFPARGPHRGRARTLSRTQRHPAVGHRYSFLSQLVDAKAPGWRRWMSSASARAARPLASP